MKSIVNQFWARDVRRRWGWCFGFFCLFWAGQACHFGDTNLQIFVCSLLVFINILLLKLGKHSNTTYHNLTESLWGYWRMKFWRRQNFGGHFHLWRSWRWSLNLWRRWWWSFNYFWCLLFVFTCQNLCLKNTWLYLVFWVFLNIF